MKVRILFHVRCALISLDKEKIIFLPDNQRSDLCDRSFSSSSAAGVEHYCTHSSNDSTRPLINSIAHQQTNEHNENLKHSAPSSTGSSSHSSSGIGSSIESPYNHWKYLTPLSVTTNDKNHLLPSSREHSEVTKLIEPIPTSST